MAKFEINDNLNRIPTTAAGFSGVQNPNFEITGFSAFANHVAAAVAAAKLSTFSACANFSGFSGTFKTSNELVFECEFTTGSVIDFSQIFAGWKVTSTPVQATDGDQVYFHFNSRFNDGKFVFRHSRTDSDRDYQTDVTVAINTTYKLRIEVLEDRTVNAFINGRAIREYPFEALTANVVVKPYVGMQSEDSVPKDFYVHKVYCSRE